MTTKILDYIGVKLYQYLASVAGGLLLAVETSIPFFLPCLLAVVLDVVSAYMLARRLHKKHPEKCDGKFKSEYKYRIIYTMIIVFIALILAAYVDKLILQGGDYAVRSVLGIFLFYQIWSILENWSSENGNKVAKALQRIMVNKAERHIGIPLSDIMLNDNKQDDGTSK